MMKTIPLKSRWQRALAYAGFAPTLSMAMMAGPDPSCASRDAVVLVRDGIGDPCVPEDESLPTFSGYSLDEVNIETRHPACKTGLCLANHFQGRVTCPSGQSADQIAAGASACTVTSEDGAVQPVTVPVAPQCASRPADSAVYCTCSCAGDNPTLSYCACPDGYTCERLLDSISRLPTDTGNSFCVKNGTDWDEHLTCP
jgi:hypothetical protein